MVSAHSPLTGVHQRSLPAETKLGQFSVPHKQRSKPHASNTRASGSQSDGERVSAPVMQLSMPLPESADQLRACGHKSERLRSGFTSAMPSDSTGKADFAGGPSGVSPMSGQGVTTMSRSLSLTRCGSLRRPFPRTLLYWTFYCPLT